MLALGIKSHRLNPPSSLGQRITNKSNMIVAPEIRTGGGPYSGIVTLSSEDPAEAFDWETYKVLLAVENVCLLNLN